MAASDGMAAFGTTLGVSTVDGGSYTTVAEVVNFDGPDMSVADVNLTHHESDDGANEYVLGLFEGGSISLELNFTTAELETLMASMRVAKDYQLTLPCTSTLEWTGYLNGLSLGMPHDGKLSATASFKVSGLPDFQAST